MPYKIRKNNYYYEVIRYYKKEQNQPTDKDYKRNYSLESQMRSKNKIIDLALNNHFTHFITITIDKTKHNRYDYETIKNKLTKEFNNYQQRKDPTFYYIIKAELHKDKAIHFHGLIHTTNLTQLKYNPYQSKKDSIRLDRKIDTYDWLPFKQKFGWTHATKIYNAQEFIAYYMSKYISKSDDHILAHRYFRSKGLKTSDEFTLDELPLIPDTLPTFNNRFVTKWKTDSKEYYEITQKFKKMGY